jgi:NAD(P)-dependent dehydrogenase (short-subunit alcohol dehydrogenase family)
MTATTSVSTVQGERGLVGQTVVVIGGSAGIGFETARRARADGAEVILTGRNPERLEHAVRELGSKARGDEVDPHRRELERHVGGRTRRRRRTRRAQHDQHRAHRRHLQHRRGQQLL